MWSQNFNDRLESWSTLRLQCKTLEREAAIQAINSWWFQTPWTPYHLHWDDRANWPDPWQLLSDNIYCPLARALGILYTICIIDREDLQDAVLVDTGSDNLVLIDQEKYILNWDQSQVLNINLGPVTIRNSVTQNQIKKQIN